MNALKSRSYITVLLHVLLWMLFAFILLFYQPLSWNIIIPNQFWVKQGCVLVLLVVIFYLNSELLVPRLLLKNRNLAYVFVILFISQMTGPMVNGVDRVLHLPELMENAFKTTGMMRPPKRKDRLDIFTFMMTLLIVGISTSVTLIQKWQEDKQLRESMEKEKIGSELSFLKAQINPHFFFNTLNNIYALTHVDVENSRRALHKLSRMMRYLLYDTQAGITPLSKEVSFIVDYIELMKLRLNDTTKVSFEGPLLQGDIQIAPMLFLPYVENAFKHGVSAVDPSVISIVLSMEDKTLEMTVKNTIFQENAEIADTYGGIGLSNTKRRLDLLYPGKHTFSAGRAEDTNEFIVHLTLVLDDTELHRS
ncbi:sensor histidine kinase [Pedobacter sp. L105]|uniref:sensor histidine kinase n=1 Tax=Pedobacter sp. L105 TaxID=1641871 RepID=UPI00131ECD1E|nr:histidine kinase [Pedobacter sp. L105]